MNYKGIEQLEQSQVQITKGIERLEQLQVYSTEALRALMKSLQSIQALVTAMEETLLSVKQDLKDLRLDQRKDREVKLL